MKNGNSQNAIGPRMLYRADLIQKAKDAAGVSFADLAKETGLAKQTVQDVVNGTASKLDPIFIISKHFGLDWSALFILDADVFTLEKTDRFFQYIAINGKPISVDVRKLIGKRRAIKTGSGS